MRTSACPSPERSNAMVVPSAERTRSIEPSCPSGANLSKARTDAEARFARHRAAVDTHAVDVQAFLRTCPPLDAIDDAALSDIVRQTEIAFFPAGASILEQSGQVSRFVYVVRVGVVELVDGGRVIDELGPGELFGHLSAMSGSSPTTEVRAREDTICYLIPTSAIEEVFSSRTGLA